MSEKTDVEGEAEVSAVYGYASDDDRREFAYGADYPLIEPDGEDEDFDDEEFADLEEEWS